MIYTKVCKHCNKDFTCNRNHKQFCSRLCHRRYPANKLKYRDNLRRFQKKHSFSPRRRYQKLEFKVRVENREFNLSLDDCVEMWNEGCYYCYKSLAKTTGVALDRIDNSKGYTKENVLPCCGVCNQIRNRHLTHNEMEVAMSAIIQYRLTK